MIQRIRKDISQFLQYFLFEILDDVSIKNMRISIENYLDHYKIENYKLNFKILSCRYLEMDISFDNNYLTFILCRNSFNE